MKDRRENRRFPAFATARLVLPWVGRRTRPNVTVRRASEVRSPNAPSFIRQVWINSIRIEDQCVIPVYLGCSPGDVTMRRGGAREGWPDGFREQGPLPRSSNGAPAPGPSAKRPAGSMSPHGHRHGAAVTGRGPDPDSASGFGHGSRLGNDRRQAGQLIITLTAGWQCADEREVDHHRLAAQALVYLAPARL